MSLELYQRQRLIRSTRKLGAILGTTPFLLDPIPTQKPFPSAPLPSPKPLRRQGKVYSTTAFIPALTAPPHNPPSKKKRNAPAPLLLTITTISVPPSDARADPLPPSPRAPTLRISFLRTLDRPLSIPITPLTPTFVTNVPAARRRKLAKVNRTLGENVPPELVFPTPAASEPEHLPPLHSFLTLSPVPAPDTPDTPCPSSAYIVPSPCTAHPPPADSFAFVPPSPRDEDSAWLCPTPAIPANREWTGGWNRSDLRDVQHGLRALKRC